MGNSQTKEARGQTTSSRRHSGSGTPSIRTETPQNGSDSQNREAQQTRPRRGSRADFSFLGIGSNPEADPGYLEQRRENKQEREARKAEKERIARLTERERSMKEEHVDGGYLVTQGVYVGPEDYSKPVVRQLMIERRLAPFWKGLNEFSESWAEHQLMAAARGMPIPPADVVPPELEYSVQKRPSESVKEKSHKYRGIPIGKSHSQQADHSNSSAPGNMSLPLPSPVFPTASSSPNTPLFRTRAKTLASLTSGRGSYNTDMTPREFTLPHDPFVNGQPIEAYLYKDATECPICFLYYPPYLNTTRCCEQAICSECFVQIKRPDPHPPEHEQPDANAPPPNDADREAQEQGLLVSEVATCPYCKTPEFGITYTPTPFRRGLTYMVGNSPFQMKSAMSSQTSIGSSTMTPITGRRRGTSLSATAPEVVTTDKVRPDWANKLAAARAHAARRAAAATALHAAAYLMNGQQDHRGLGSLGRRTLLRRPTLESNHSSGANPHIEALTLLAERHAATQQEAGLGDTRTNPFLGHMGPPRSSGSRRTRMDDLEEMMMMEAIRLSLASEEERRRKEEKEAKKEAKKKEKEAKKAEKAARKNSFLSTSASTSINHDLIGEVRAELMHNRVSDTTPEEETDDQSQAVSGKGKEIDKPSKPPTSFDNSEEDNPRENKLPGASFSGTSQESLSPSMPIPTGAEPFRRSHLRQMSNASSSASSFIESGSVGGYTGSHTPPGGSLEPMFNFQSLAAMVGEEDKAEAAAHLEEARNGSFDETTDSPGRSIHKQTTKVSSEEVGPSKALNGSAHPVALSQGQSP